MTIEYTNWHGEKKTWNPETTERYYLLLDKILVAESGAYFAHSASMYAPSPDGVKKNLRKFLIDNPGFVADWRAAGAKIVKAPCAFDARENHVIMEVL